MKQTNQTQLRNTVLTVIILLTSLYSFSASSYKKDPSKDGSPVTLTSFSVKQSKKVVELAWSTSRETNTNHFILQRSIDGKSFSELAVIVTGEDSYVHKTYRFSDERPVRGNKSVYYRLKIVDRDGQFIYSDVKVISKGKTAEIVF